MRGPGPGGRGQDAAAGFPCHELTGLVGHLRWAEAFWIDVIFLGQPNQWPGTDDDFELQMRAGLARPLAELLDAYAAQTAHTDDVVASRDWDAEAARYDFDTGKPIALRYIVMHLIERLLGTTAISTSSANSPTA